MKTIIAIFLFAGSVLYLFSRKNLLSKDTITPIGIYLFVALVIYVVVREVRRNNSFDAWAQSAQELGGRHLVAGTPYQKGTRYKLSDHERQTILCPEKNLTVQAEPLSTTLTILGAFPSFFWVVVRTRAYEPHGLTFGDSEFETYRLTHSNNAELAKEVLSNELRRSLVALTGDYDVEIKEGTLKFTRNSIENSAERFSVVLKLAQNIAQQGERLMSSFALLAQSLNGQYSDDRLLFVAHGQSFVLRFVSNGAEISSQLDALSPTDLMQREFTSPNADFYGLPGSFKEDFVDLSVSSVSCSGKVATLCVPGVVRGADRVRRLAALLQLLLPQRNEEPYRA